MLEKKMGHAARRAPFFSPALFSSDGNFFVRQEVLRRRPAKRCTGIIEVVTLVMLEDNVLHFA
jgi:hypothetical protein